MHQSMNTSYRLVWNESTGTWCVAHELARGRGKGGTQRRALRPAHALILIAALLQSPPLAHADVLVRNANVNGAGGVELLDTSARSIVIGNASIAPLPPGQDSMAIGNGARAPGENSQAIGLNTYADGKAAMALGPTAQADGDGATSIGRQAC